MVSCPHNEKSLFKDVRIKVIRPMAPVANRQTLITPISIPSFASMSHGHTDSTRYDIAALTYPELRESESP